MRRQASQAAGSHRRRRPCPHSPLCRFASASRVASFGNRHRPAACIQDNGRAIAFAMPPHSARTPQLHVCEAGISPTLPHPGQASVSKASAGQDAVRSSQQGAQAAGGAIAAVGHEIADELR